MLGGFAKRKGGRKRKKRRVENNEKMPCCTPKYCSSHSRK